jgi:hypothetical protein
VVYYCVKLNYKFSLVYFILFYFIFIEAFVKNISKKDIINIAKMSIDKFQKRFKQEIYGENEEFVDRTLRNQRDRIARISWKNACKWCKFDQDGPVLMPDCTRIYYRKGNTEILLQEFAPQTRFLKFKGSVVNRINNYSQITQEEEEKIYNFSLPLPYTIFVFKYVDGLFFEVKCAFSDRPLKKLEERPLKPYLPNIDTNLSVCLGLSFDKSKLIVGDVAQQSALVLNHFWHSIFTNEWSSNYWNLKSYFESNDSRLADFESWQKSGIENSLFVIEDVQWMGCSEDSFGEIISNMLKDDSKNSFFEEDLYNEISEDVIKEVVKTFYDSIDVAEERVSEMFFEKISEEILKNIKNN